MEDFAENFMGYLKRRSHSPRPKVVDTQHRQALVVHWWLGRQSRTLNFGHRVSRWILKGTLD
jgi:hypothetical protein